MFTFVGETFTVGILVPKKVLQKLTSWTIHVPCWAHQRLGQDSEICRVKPVAKCHLLEGIRPRYAVDWLVEILPKL